MLTQEQKSNLDCFRAASGELYRPPHEQQYPYQGGPALVIGLGGTGIDAMLRVKEAVNDIFNVSLTAFSTGNRIMEKASKKVTIQLKNRSDFY
ncbi:MAG: hypothetical protein IJ168_00250 [Eubacterium sp.]|nr:hypothetical protein [Eubacterium sp.]